jgi:hypothetical protein
MVFAFDVLTMSIAPIMLSASPMVVVTRPSVLGMPCVSMRSSVL